MCRILPPVLCLIPTRLAASHRFSFCHVGRELCATQRGGCIGHAIYVEGCNVQYINSLHRRDRLFDVRSQGSKLDDRHKRSFCGASFHRGLYPTASLAGNILSVALKIKPGGVHPYLNVSSFISFSFFASRTSVQSEAKSSTLFFTLR